MEEHVTNFNIFDEIFFSAMLRHLLLLFFTFWMSVTTAQLNDHKFHLSAKYSMGSVQSTRYSNYSLNGEILLKKIGLNYNFDYTVRRDSIRQFHATMGILGAPILFGIGLLNSVDSDTTNTGAFGIIGGIILLVLPDGISYHISPRYNWDMAPYANILGLDFVRDRRTNQRSIKYACSFGIKTTYLWREMFTISAFVETRQAAGYGWGFGGGIGLGVALGTK
jgi:hypothetical protein